jgi:nucleoside recognition membrane protein YjiH
VISQDNRAGDFLTAVNVSLYTLAGQASIAGGVLEHFAVDGGIAALLESRFFAALRMTGVRG